MSVRSSQPITTHTPCVTTQAKAGRGEHRQSKGRVQMENNALSHFKSPDFKYIYNESWHSLSTMTSVVLAPDRLKPRALCGSSNAAPCGGSGPEPRARRSPGSSTGGICVKSTMRRIENEIPYLRPFNLKRGPVLCRSKTSYIALEALPRSAHGSYAY